MGTAEVPALVAHAGHRREIEAQIVRSSPRREVGGIGLQGGDAAVLHALHYNYALRRSHQGNIPSQHAYISTVVHVGVAEEDGSHVKSGKLAQGEIGGDEIGAVDVEPGQNVEVHQVVDASCVSILEELFVEEAVLAEVLAEIQEYAFSLLLQVDLVASDAVGPVVDRERCDFGCLLLLLSDADR